MHYMSWIRHAFAHMGKAEGLWAGLPELKKHVLGITITRESWMALLRCLDACTVA
jgi:hypothetical protein